MKPVLCSLLFAAVSLAQSLVLTAPSRAAAGQTVPVVLSFANPGGADVAALQWTVTGGTLPASQPAIANKARMCAPGTTVCIVFGVVPSPINGAIASNATFNNLPIPSGPLQNLEVTIPALARPGDTITVQVFSVFGASSNGTAVSVPVTPAVVMVTDPLDLNSDGNVDGADMQAALYQWRGAPTMANFLLLAALTARLHQ